MWKNLIVINFLILVITSCTPKNNNIVFNGTVEYVFENNIIVSTKDDVGFDRASVSYDKTVKLDFVPEEGQMVRVEILPEIRESYPVQVTAVRIELVNDDMIKKAEYKKISSDDAKKIMVSEDVIVLDVRTLEEYNDGHISKALLLPVTEIEQKSEEVLKNKSGKILVYCRSGNRSATASKLLIEMGYTEVYDFGGIIDWPYEIVK